MKKIAFRTLIGRSVRMSTTLALVLTATAATAHAGACPPVPEIDPGSILSAMTLLSGGVLVLTDRRRRVAK